MATNEDTIVMGNGNASPNNNVPPRPTPQQQTRPTTQQRPAYQPAQSNSGQTWKRVVLGGVAGVMFGTVSAAGATTAYYHFRGNDEEVVPEGNEDVAVDAIDAEGGHYTMPNGLEVAEVDQDLSFSEAFAAARAEVGPGGVFVWHGGVYGTYTADEWNSMTPQQHAEFAQLTAPTIQEVSPVTHPTDHTDVAIHEEEGHYVNDDDDVVVSTPNDDDVQIVGIQDVELADGSTVTMGMANMDGHEVYLVDVDQDGVFDVAAVDANGNGSLDDNEYIDISGHGITYNGGGGTVVTNETDDFDNGSDPMLTETSNGDDGLLVDNTLPGVDDNDIPDYTNDATGDILV